VAIPKSVKDREYLKFIESPTRPEETAIEVLVGNADPIEVSVTNGASKEGKTSAAGEVLSAVKAIYSNGTNIFLGDASEDFQHASIVGISITAGGIGEEVRYLLSGCLFDSSFSFTDGEPVYLAENGNITQNDPVGSGYIYRVLIGYATGTNGLNINIQEPIII
jgi:hypothetical protein